LDFEFYQVGQIFFEQFIKEGVQLNIENLKDGDPLDDSFVALATEAGISQEVFNKMTFNVCKLIY
jgi:hypothetical protein